MTRSKTASSVSTTEPSSSGKMPALLKSTCRAPNSLLREGNHRLHVGAAADVGAHERGDAALAASSASTVALPRRFIAVDDHDARPFARERARRRAPDATAGAGDQRHFVLQTS